MFTSYLTMNIKFPRLPKAVLKVPPGFKKPKVADFKADMQKLGEEIAEDFKGKIIDNIENNTYGFSIKESTANKKGSSIPLINTHQLVDAIYREGTKVSVENSSRKDSSLTNLQLAIVHEYGVKDKGIPARPVWRNTYADFREEARKRVATFLKRRKFNEGDND